MVNERKEDLEQINREIAILQELLRKAGDCVDELHHPLLLRISEILDEKLNKQYKLRNSNKPTP